MPRLVGLLLIAILSLSLSAVNANADTDISSDQGGVSLREGGKRPGSKPANSRNGSGRRAPNEKESAEKKVAEQIRDYKARLSIYLSKARAYNLCVDKGSTGCQKPTEPTPPGRQFGEVNALPVNTISDEDAAYIAFARLRLTPPSPVVGPSPDLNRWKMAAVGYPLWLSVAGDPNPPAVADAVADVHVRLEARVSRVVFSMGDHHSVSCTNLTTSWSKAVAGRKSPVCGYTYQQPSLPEGSYTVTATTYWSVAWSTSGGSGIIPFVQSSSTELPVGELQVLVR